MKKINECNHDKIVISEHTVGGGFFIKWIHQKITKECFYCGEILSEETRLIQEF